MVKTPVCCGGSIILAIGPGPSGSSASSYITGLRLSGSDLFKGNQKEAPSILAARLPTQRLFFNMGVEQQVDHWSEKPIKVDLARGEAAQMEDL